MYSAILFFLTISALATFTSGLPNYRTASNQITAEHFKFNKTSEELESTFSSSIIYWDLDYLLPIPEMEKVDMKQDIMQKLVHVTEESRYCMCSRKAMNTLVCDTNGKLHASICNFHCRFVDSKKAGIKPVMIFTETPFQNSKKMCQVWYKGEFKLPSRLQG